MSVKRGELQDGVKKWNDLRSQTPLSVRLKIPLNLSGANLQDADLSGADLSGVSLSGAILVGVNLQDANLSCANLREAYLLEANLCGANLTSADGRSADWTDVTYVRANWMHNLRMRYLTWRFVRAVGRLQVLTKASYLTLAIVPILAGLWLGVKTWLAAAHLPTAMPSAYALGFFAALCVALGHTIYQIRCPELVAEKSPDQFAQEILAEFSFDADDRNDRLARALNALKEITESDPKRRNRNLARRHGKVIWLPSELEFFEPPPECIDPNNDDSTNNPESPPRPTRQLMRLVVEEGALAEYEQLAIRDQGSAMLAIFLYLFAGLIILWLMCSQAYKVALASDWV